MILPLGGAALATVGAKGHKSSDAAKELSLSYHNRDVYQIT